jgi:hypothetical protein
MKMKVRLSIFLIAATALILFGMGSACPGTGSSGSFSNPRLLTAISTHSAKSWRYPAMIVDVGAADITSANLQHDQNAIGTWAGWPIDETSLVYPMATFHDALGNFFLAFDRLNDPVAASATADNMFVLGQSDITSASWVSGLGSFTQLDSPTGTYSVRPISATDSLGNSMLVFSTLNAGGTNAYPVASYHSGAAGTWTAWTNMQDTAAADDATVRSMAVGADSYNNFIVAHMHDFHLYFNAYRPNLGWRFTSADSPYPHWEMPGDTPTYGGVEVGFDGYGNGYGAYVNDSGGGTYQIKTARWIGTTPENFPDPTDPAVNSYYNDASSGATQPVAFPALSVRSDGSATVFYWAARDVFGVGYAELWYSETAANSSTATGAFSVARRFDDQAGDSSLPVQYNLVDPNGAEKPMVATNGNYAAVGFIKSDSAGVTHLYVYRYYGGTWTSLGTVDQGLAGVPFYGNLSINASGSVAVAFSSYDTLGYEHPWVNVYSSGQWQGLSQLDANGADLASSGLMPELYGNNAATRPSVTIYDNGNAVASYTMRDVDFAVRRALIVVYR